MKLEPLVFALDLVSMKGLSMKIQFEHICKWHEEPTGQNFLQKESSHIKILVWRTDRRMKGMRNEWGKRQ